MSDLTRRQALTALGTVSLGALLAACGRDDATSVVVTTTDGASATVEPRSSGSPDVFDDGASCTLTVEQTEGPFYLDVDAIRSDIREDREGVTLVLAMKVDDADECLPIADAVVEVWHCDAMGSYSGVEAETGTTYLRGAQVTDTDGVVWFTTIYPGWYSGRTPHIHFKVHVDGASSLTSQLYFDDAVSDAVYAAAPYEPGRDTFNDGDGIFDASTVLTLSADGDGYLGVMTVGVVA